MRVAIGTAIVLISIYFLGWWGTPSIILAIIFIGWKDRHNGPLPTNQTQGKTANYSLAKQMSKDMPLSFKLMQDILVKTSKKNTSDQDLLQMLKKMTTYIRVETLMNSESNTMNDKLLLYRFISKFSDIFPNWQREYGRLNQLIEISF